ncbi:MAG: hypothetical protein E7492_06395 [Ruminococcaceae bacterium]|nr:hypothetical protein [Oscillospiraceae bacterium]
MNKSYKGLMLWVIIFIAGMCVPPLLPIDDTALITNLSLLYCTAAITVLIYIIYRYDKIYWINGVIFEDAEKMTRQQRNEFTYAHFVKFRNCFIIHLVFAVAAHFFDFPIWAIITLPMLLLIATAISTIKIKTE